MTHMLERWLERYESGQLDRRTFLQGLASLTAASSATVADTPQALVAPSGLHHVEIKTTDLARSRAFYTKLFGQGTTGETRPDRVIIPFGSGAGRGYLSIGVGPIARVDHFSAKVPGMHPTDLKATLAKLTSAGFRARQAGNTVLVMDPDGYEVQMQAPTTTP